MSKTKQQKQAKPSVWTISNMMSLFRLLLSIPLAFLFTDPYGNQLYIFAMCFLAYLTDIGDGFVARLRNETSDLGRMLDPLADKVFVITVVIAMLLTRLLPPWFVIVVMGRDALIFFAGIYLKKKTGILVESNYLGKAAVISVMAVIVIALFQQDFSAAALHISMLIALGLMTASLYMYGERYFKLMKKQQAKR